MNPHDPHGRQLYRGNIGRYNFGGTGSDGSFQDLRLSPVGGIVSFPNLPAHYINLFAPCVAFDDQVGGTAFIHGSHRLDFTAKYCGHDNDNSAVYPYLTRPCLTLGDVVLFDCRVLHFGLANTSTDINVASATQIHGTTGFMMPRTGTTIVPFLSMTPISE
eukprot:CAMPEP_0178882564 /NCGR_PEP_ID=MMETSP0747-20121128/13589_1 /TAXON_ID=913974 /ORGANISM="Nitzschia punctata, Strain CCMP561" /LENGTH=160 /DNA_ID=CAMNT_0020550583 /DNA_START=29 /DNA_END=509 /DNA_ORIENTATION=+